MDIYTKKGDDGTTGLFYGGRVRKDDPAPEAYGSVDEAVAVLATARAVADDDLAGVLLQVQRELFVVAAELATAPENRHKLEPGVSRVTEEMVLRLETRIDEIVADIGQPTEFIVPGDNPLSAALDHARTVVRRAERRCLTYARSGGLEDSEVIRYLNRLADYVYTLVRATESEWKPSRTE
ncbi:MAG: cob(I)yrinic acid a,c-diamide adenosyltransferase [Acidimicrobiia bacterium]